MKPLRPKAARPSCDGMPPATLAVLDALQARVVLVDAAGKVTTVNAAWKSFAAPLLGADLAHGVGLEYLELARRTCIRSEADGERVAAGLRSVLSGESAEFTLELACPQNAARWFRLTLTCLPPEAGPGAVILHTDISERRQAEEKARRLRDFHIASSRIHGLIARGGDLQDIYENACRLAVEQAGLRMAWVGLASADGLIRPAALWGHNDGYVELLQISDDPEQPGGRGPAGQAFRTGAPACCNDIEADDGSLYTRTEALQRGYRSCAVFPLAPAGRITGVLAVYSGEANCFGDEEFELLGLLAESLSHAMHSHALEEERQRSEQALRASEASLAAAQQVGKVGSWETDTATLVVRWSRETHRIFETDPEHFQPTHAAFLELVHPDDLHRVDRAFADSLGKPGVHTLEHRLRMPDGRVKYVEERWQTFFDEQGAPVKAIGTCQEITERRLAEQQIQRSEALLRAVTDGAPDAIFVKDLEGRYLLFNEGAARLVGKPVAEVLGCDDTAVFEPEGAQLVRENDRLVLASGQSLTAEEILTAGGITRTYLVTKSPHRDSEGRIIGLIGISRDITAQRRAEQALLASESRLRAIVENEPECVKVVAPDGRLLDMNPAGLHMIEAQSLEAVRNCHVDSLVHPQDRESFKELHERNLAGYTGQLRFRIIGLRGTERWMETHATPLFDSNGSVQSVLSVTRDVTERRHSEEALRQSEERFREMAENIDEVFFNYDPIHNRLLYASPAFERLWGRPLDEVIANPTSYLESVHPEDRPAAEDAFQRQLAGETTQIEFRILMPDGSARWIQETAVAVKDDSQRVERIVGTMRDITAGKLAEERLREQATLLDKAQDAILVRDLDHRILYWNKSAERLYGWSMEEAVGQASDTLLYRDTAAFAAAHAITIGRGEWTGELEQITKDGKRLTVEVHWSLVRDDKGEPKSVLAINTDVTERKRIEQQFLRAQRMESIGTLAGGIAHDLNNVLAPILMSIELLKLDETRADKLDVLTTIESSAQRGADMVRQVLSFARGVEGRQIRLQPAHLVREVAKIANETFLKSIRVVSRIAEDLWTIQGDPTQLHQVLLNLCVNARDAMPEGGTLTLCADNLELDATYAASLGPDIRPGRHVRLRVEDTGSGMPPEVLERIFDPFFTTKEPGKGTGLGLSTAQAIVRSHGGLLRAQSEPGEGTRFDLYLPALEGVEAEPAIPVRQLPRGSGQTVLVVDDEDSVRQIARQTLQTFGYRVLLASDGAEATAIFAARHREIDVVLTDMMMPVMDGAAAIQVLLRICPGARILASSGLHVEAMRARAERAGVRHFIPKPYTTETLLQALHEVLGEPPPHGVG